MGWADAQPREPFCADDCDAVRQVAGGGDAPDLDAQEAHGRCAAGGVLGCGAADPGAGGNLSNGHITAAVPLDGAGHDCKGSNLSNS